MLNPTSKSDLKAHLLSHDSFTENHTSLIEASDKFHCAEPTNQKLLESLDVDPINHPYYVDSCRMPPETLNGNQQIIFTSKSFYRWVLTIVLGIGIAICAYFIQNSITVRNRECVSRDVPKMILKTVCGQILVNYRNQKLQEYANDQQTLLLSLLHFMIFNFSLAMVGALLTVYLEPAAASDGIAEIKGVLLSTRIQSAGRAD